MPKLKTKSSTKGRFRVTGSGKILRAFACKRHMLIRRSQKMKRQARGLTVMSKPDSRIIRRFMPYA
ncbi:MAG: 50S ribosomal protein L35 [Candidatus Nucleicultricaceae bacterium]|nr:MAG: 50S ribosomal protein L35 [Caedimonadaceae bacterium]